MTNDPMLDLVSALMGASKADAERLLKRLSRDKLEKAALAYLILVAKIVRTGGVAALLDNMTQREAEALLDIATEFQQAIDEFSQGSEK